MDSTILKMLLNEFRSDFGMIDQYKYIPETEEERFDIPVAVFAGKGWQSDSHSNTSGDGTVTQEALTSWKKHTKDFTLKMMPGNHTFFMNSEEVFQEFMNELYAYLLSKLQQLQEKVLRHKEISSEKINNTYNRYNECFA